MHKNRKVLLIFFLLPVLTVLGSMHLFPDGVLPPELPRTARVQLQQEIRQARKLLKNQAADIDTLEAALIHGKLSVLDTDSRYPTYLANHFQLLSFWDSVQKGQDAFFSFFSIPNGETLRHLCFLHSNGEPSFFTADVQISSGTVIGSAYYPVHEMELSDWDIFYYRLFPAGDPHYVDFSQIRLNPPDRTLFDACRKYILPVGYQMVNLFLVDWQEGDWGSLSFPDTLEFLYTRNTGSTLHWEDYPRDSYPSRVRIPAKVFEESILPYFQITPEELRRHCGYDSVTKTYPYRSIRGDDLTSWHYVMCEPEVMDVQTNPDGTLTLNVQVYSPDLKTDRLFCHDLTVRPLGEEGFQYVSNHVTYVSSYGLPPVLSRFALDE